MTSRTADKIKEEIEQLIVTGDIADGERLDETSLAKQFDVSRTPLREAFQGLAASGLVELIPHRGAFVRHPGFLEMIEMFEVMAELEAMCGRLAARRISEADQTALKDAALKCEEALARGEHDEYYRENERFHHILYQASGNSFLTKEATRLHRRLQPFRRMQLRVRGRMSQSMEEHREIVDAVIAGDEGRVMGALRDHVAIQGEKFNDLMASYSKKSSAAE